MANHDVGVVVNDLLCFVQNKVECVPMEKLKPILVSGFKEEAIMMARDVLFETANNLQGHEEMNVRKQVHRQTGKSSVGEMNVQDILKIFTECIRLGLSLPKFAAII